MEGMVLSPLNPSAFDALYKRVRADFPPEERPPRAVLRRNIARGDCEAWILREAGGEEVAYALCTAFEGAVLVTHLAVYADRRGQGVGSELLRQLARQYAGAARLIVEVERPGDTTDPARRTLRERRIAYYRRAGFCCYFALEYSIWRVPMYLMVLPLGGAALPTEEQLRRDLHGVYARLLPPAFRHMVRFP